VRDHVIAWPVVAPCDMPRGSLASDRPCDMPRGCLDSIDHVAAWPVNIPRGCHGGTLIHKAGYLELPAALRDACGRDSVN
jgi:hypothetical protein